MSAILNESVNGTINVKGDHDWIKVNLDANKLYALGITGLESNGISGSMAVLFDSTGTLAEVGLSHATDVAAFMLPTTGTYYFDVSSFLTSVATGDYSVSLYTSPDDYFNNTSTTGTLAVGGSSSGLINLAGDEDWFRLTLNANTLYSITTTRLVSNGVSNVSLDVFDASGNFVPALDTSGFSALGFMPSVSGTYYLAARSINAGDYTVNLATSSDDYSNNPTTTGVVNVGSSVSGTINVAGDHDWFRVNLTANTLYDITTTGLSPSGYSLAELAIFDANGIAMDELEDLFSDANGFMTDTSGTYYIDVGSSAAGAYTLNVAVSPDDYLNNVTTTGNLAVGGTVNGVFNLEGDHDWFKVSLDANTLYAITTTGGSMIGMPSTAFIQIRDSAGDLLPALDASGYAGAAGFMPTTSGNYFIDLSSFYLMDETGAYSLSLASSPDDYLNNVTTSGTVSAGGSASGVLNVVGDHDWFKVNLTANQLYAISTTGLDSSGQSLSTLSVIDASGQPVAAFDGYGSGAIGFMPVTSGNYFIDVTGTSITEIGAYTLSVATSLDDYRSNITTSGSLGGVQADTAAPAISTFLPADEAIDIAVNSNIVVTFSEAIAKGVGNITLKTAAGATVATYDAASSGNISISGNTLTLNPTADLDFNTGYKVEFAAGTVKDLAGNSYAGTTSYNFTTIAASSQGTIGTSGNDKLTGTTGDDSIDGLAGTDTAHYLQRHAAYGIESGGNGRSINGPEGYDTLASIERLNFADAHLAFDTEGYAGQVYRLYKAAFARTPDLPGLGNWIEAMDNGTKTLTQVATAFAGSDEFTSLYGSSTSNEQFVTLLYLNALGRAPGTGEVAGWANQITAGSTTRAQVLTQFSESAENKAAVQSKIADGILYATADQTSIATQGLTLTGTESADSLIGSVAKDQLNGLGGDDHLNGGAGVDTAVYKTRSGYSITRTDTGLSVSGEGTDTLINIERLQFSDGGGLAFDTSGNAGQVYRLYQAAFDRTPDTAGLSDWLRGMDTGMTLQKVATGFIGSAEFQGLYGTNPTDAAFVDLLYQNVLNRDPDAGGEAYWLDELDRGMTREMALIGFSESAENQAAVIGVIQDGIEFMPG